MNVTVFVNYEGFVHDEYAPRGHPINKEYNVDVQKKLRDGVEENSDIFCQAVNDFFSAIMHQRIHQT